MNRWTEGHVHIRMRRVLRQEGYSLVAGEFPGGSDHELYPLCVTDPSVARDNSPDPRRHSAGELIPDIVALSDRNLVLGEAKLDYDEPDREKLSLLLSDRLLDLKMALEKFALERGVRDLLPIGTLKLSPLLIFTDRKLAPAVPDGFSFLVLRQGGEYEFRGHLASCTQ